MPNIEQDITAPQGARPQQGITLKGTAEPNIKSLKCEEIIGYFDMYKGQPESDTETFKTISKDKIRAKGINIDRIGAQVGSGQMGTAYGYDNRILKITGDLTETAASATILGKDLPGVVKIFKVLVFPENYGKATIGNQRVNVHLDRPAQHKQSPNINNSIVMAWILQEKLKPLRGGVKAKIEQITTQKEFIAPKRNIKVSFAGLVRDYVYETNDAKAEEIKADITKQLAEKHRVSEIYPGFWEAIDGLKRVGVRWHDVHKGNLMENDAGKICIIDLGISQSPKGKAPDEIKLEHLLRQLKRKGLLK